MADILHRVGIKSPSTADTYNALTAIDGLSGWWTNETSGESKVGEMVRFRFGDRGFFDMRVVELDPGKRVLWQVADGPQEWIDTKVGFELKQEDDFTVVLFKHQGWKEPIEFMHHCSTKWGTFLLSLKAFVETGKGAPYPNDVRIDNWL